MTGKPREPSRQAVARLRVLLEQKQAAEADTYEITDRLAEATARAVDVDGEPQAGLARALGVGTSTVHGWVKRGRQLNG